MKPQTLPPHEVFSAAIRLIRRELIPGASPQRQRLLDKVVRILARARRRLGDGPPRRVQPPLREPEEGEDLEIWGHRLRMRREATGLSRLQLARLAGLSDGTIRNLERGRHRPTRTTLSRLRSVPGLVGGAAREDSPLSKCLGEHGWQLVRKWRYAEDRHPRLLFICRKAEKKK